jgi:ATP-binding cassette subfamily G (WHITE) protein 2
VPAPQLKYPVKSFTSYILQDDSFTPQLTVRETLRFSQRMYIVDRDDAHIDQILSTLQLQTCSETRVGSELTRGVSGGQRRRLSIAVGLLSCPSLLILDEPTTGLDSANARRVGACLRAIACSGLSVCMSIHQVRRGGCKNAH